MLDDELENSLRQAWQLADEKQHQFVTVEHVLLALLRNPSAAQVLRHCKADLQVLHHELEAFIAEHTPPLGLAEKKRHNATQKTKATLTLGVQRVLQRATIHARSSGRTQATGANVLVAVFGERECHASHFLNKHGITRLNVVQIISHGHTHHPPFAADTASEYAQADESHAAQDTKLGSILEQLTHKLSEPNSNRQDEPLIGHQQTLQRTMQVLCRRRKNNPLYVGEPGVGKTALAEGLAQQLGEGKAPPLLAGAAVYALNKGALLSGTRYRGDLEQRVQALSQALQAEKGAILFIDELHTLIGSGGGHAGSGLDIFAMFKPSLENGGLRCIGTTTYQEFREISRKDPALSRCFQKIDVAEPSIEETRQILEGIRPHYEAHHGVRYSSAALSSAAELAHRYIHERFLPDKAIDLIDEAGAAKQLADEPSRNLLDTKDIERIVARIARIPEQTVSRSDKAMLKNIQTDLKQLIFGQDQAIQALSDAIKMSRAGLGKETQPIASFLFAGPTGVGKTELAKQLAVRMDIEFIRFDMSEYMERHTVSRLIGAPPGYVGYEQQGGLLSNAITQHPYSVLLLDEIEKAHPDLFNLLLQVFDNGCLTDTRGCKTDFRNTIIIMTTNAGAEQISRRSVGFTLQNHGDDLSAEIKKLFSPELRNRLDGIIQFNTLDAKAVASVVDKLLGELESQLDKQNVAITVTKAAKSWLCLNGQDPILGVRPMRRLIQKHIKKPLAEALLFGCLSDDQDTNRNIRVDTTADQNGLTVETDSADLA